MWPAVFSDILHNNNGLNNKTENGPDPFNRQKYPGRTCGESRGAERQSELQGESWEKTLSACDKSGISSRGLPSFHFLFFSRLINASPASFATGNTIQKLFKLTGHCSQLDLTIPSYIFVLFDLLFLSFWSVLVQKGIRRSDSPRSVSGVQSSSAALWLILPFAYKSFLREKVLSELSASVSRLWVWLSIYDGKPSTWFIQHSSNNSCTAIWKIFVHLL